MKEEYNPDIVSVVDEDGAEHVFEELDRIETDKGKYVALLPCFDNEEDILEGDGDIIILKVFEDGDEIYLEAIEDEAEFNEVGPIFEERLAEMFEVDDEEESEEE